MTWRAVVRSAIGTRHYHKNLPCQDYGHFVQCGPVIVGAVSDGAGSARHSEVGSRLAVETALSQFSESKPLLIKAVADTSPESSGFEADPLLNGFPAAWPWPWDGSGLPQSDEISIADWSLEGLGQVAMPTEAEVKHIFSAMVTTVVSALKDHASENGYALRDLACTLLTFIATPDWIAAMQIGDGFIVVDSPEAEFELLFPPSKGEYINETCFITSEGALEQMQVGVYPHRSQFICAATDGLERVALRLQDWSPFPPFFRPFADCLRVAPEQADTFLETFLDSERLNSRTDDDKTLLLCLLSPDQDQQDQEDAG